MRAVLVGDGPGRKDVERCARELGVEDRVDFIGKVPHEKVSQYLAASNAAALPDCTDIICPIKIQEYMAMELATVVPDYPCNREVITEGQTGLLFEPKNEQSLADKLALLAKDSKTRAALGKQARQEVLRRFTWEKTWGKTLQEIMHRINSSA
jgi:glycosyltransferase involved in cell wall biosynthesis